MAFHKPCNKDNNFHGFCWLTVYCVCLSARSFGFRERGDRRWRGEKLVLPERLPCPSHWAGPFTEWDLPGPSQQPCKLASIIHILRAGCQYSKKSAQDCRMQTRSVDVWGIIPSGIMMNVGPPVGIWWWGFAHPWWRGATWGGMEQCSRNFGPRDLVKLWWHTCVIRSLSYVQENHKAQLLRVSKVALVVKNPPANAGDRRDAGLIPGLGRSLDEGMATHSSILAWRIPWTEAWQATVHRVANSQTWWKQLSMHICTHQSLNQYCSFQGINLERLCLVCVHSSDL